MPRLNSWVVCGTGCVAGEEQRPSLPKSESCNFAIYSMKEYVSAEISLDTSESRGEV